MATLKKRLAIVLAVCLVVMNTVPAFAAVDNEPQTDNTKTESTFENDADVEIASPSNAETEEITEEEPVEEEEAEFFGEAKVGNVIITAKAEAGVVPKGTVLWAAKVVDKKVNEAIDEVVEEKREDEAQVVESLKFDIQLRYNGEEIEPKGKVSIDFAFADAVANAEANIYHIIEDEETKELVEAEVLEVEKVEEPEEETPLVLETETPSFSYYVVEFTVGEYQYVLEGDKSVKLSEILDELNIEGTVTKAVSGAPELFSVEKDAEGDDWTVTALQAFSTKEWMKVTIDGRVYEIVVTDSSDPHTHNVVDGGDITFENKIENFNQLESLFTTGGSGYLAKDIDCTNALQVKANVTLCLNDHVLNFGGNKSSIYVVGKTFNLYDCGTTVHYYSVDDAGLWTLNSSGTSEYTTTGGVITGGTGVPGTDGTKKNGGGVYVGNDTGSYGEFNMYGGNIAGNKAKDFGGGVYVEQNATFTMNGGTICGCKAEKGGGVFTYGTFAMNESSEIVDCKATIDGGGVCACNCAFAMNDNSKVSKCTADNGGGGVYIWAASDKNASFTMSDNSTISGCSANSTYEGNLRSGGGVCVEGDGCTFTMNGGSICKNNVTEEGGGVNVFSGTIKLGGDAKITDNVKGGTNSSEGFTGGTANNVFLPNSKYITLDTETKPTGSFKVGVTTQTAPTEGSVKITINGTADDAAYFTSDNDAYKVQYNNTENYLELAVNNVVAKIGNVGYEKFSDAVSAAKKAQTTDGKTITIVGTVNEAYSFAGDCSGITFLGSDTGKVTKGWTVQGNQTNMSNITIKNVKFVDGGNIVFSIAASDYSGLKIQNCTFTGTGGESTPAIQIGTGTAPFDGIKIIGNTISGFNGTSSSAIIFNNDSGHNEDGTVTIEGNTVTDFGYNGVQFVLAKADLVIKDNIFTCRKTDKDVLNLNSAKSVTLTGNRFFVPADYSTGNQIIWNNNAGIIVDATDNTFKKGDNTLTSIQDLAAHIAGYANNKTFVGYGLTKDDGGKLTGGYLCSYNEATEFPTALIAEGYGPVFTEKYGSVNVYKLENTVHTHTPILTKGQAPTQEAAGWKDYYECDCGALFEDAKGNTPIEDLATWKAEGGKGYLEPLPKPAASQIVTFIYRNGQDNSTVKVSYNGKVAEPTAPVMTGYAFDGWCFDADCKYLYDFNKPVIDNLSLYARWKKNDAGKEGNVRTEHRTLEVTEVQTVNPDEEKLLNDLKKNTGGSVASADSLADAVKSKVKEEVTKSGKDVILFIDTKLTDIQVEKSQTGATEKATTTLTYDATPYMSTVRADGIVEETKPISNSDLNGNITLRLPVPKSITEKYVNIIHSSDGYPKKTYKNLEIVNKGTDRAYVEIQISHFSTFELTFSNEKVIDPVPPSRHSGSASTLFTGTWGNPVRYGLWEYDPATDKWSYTTSRKFTDTWACIANPYANNEEAWFYFDRNGNMLTGWHLLFWNGSRKWYYFNPEKNNRRGKCQLGGVTPDGWTVDESGAWIESIPKK